MVPMQLTSLRRHLPILALLALALIVGILVLPHYGESWDEADIRRYSAYAVDAYRYFFHPADLPEFNTNLNLYGPGYFVLAGLLANVLHAVIPAWTLTTTWHAAYFFTFLIGVLLLYLLAIRFVGPWGAFGTALLFISQPLFWGHAFINPKDLPFLTFFLAAVYLGMRMVDRLQQEGRRGLVLLAPAVVLGFTSSLRVLGPLAGVIVLAWAAWKLRGRLLVPAILYVLIAGLSLYLSWPFLWRAPVSHFLDSLDTMADFPFNGAVLFAGKVYEANAIPVAYVPTFLGIQLTESALLLILAGLVLALSHLRRREARSVLILFLGWFLLPAGLIVASRSPLYDNARQLYFLLPPLFLLSGLALDWIFQFIRHPMWRGAILLLIALPGILIGARLHPYEYTYYNALVRGTGGAFRQFETDYWGTSFDEVMAYANASLAAGTKVVVYGPEQIVASAARRDIHVFIPREGFNPGYDYVILLTRSNADQRLCRDADPIFSVGRRGAVFAELRSIPPGSRCQ
jgi:hypothetical protein